MAIDIVHRAVGMTEEEATEFLTNCGLTVTVGRRDKERFRQTSCMPQPNRVVLEVDQGVVFSAVRG